MRLPRNVSGEELAKRLHRVGYAVTRQTGSHMRVTTGQPSQHHVTIPRHTALRVGLLAAVLEDVAAHLKLTRDELLARLFD